MVAMSEKNISVISGSGGNQGLVYEWPLPELLANLGE